MNFIRFVKTPRITTTPQPKKSPSKQSSNAKGKTSSQPQLHLTCIVTITSDFSPFAGSAKFACRLTSSEITHVCEEIIYWNPGDREIKVDLPLPSNFTSGFLKLWPLPLSELSLWPLPTDFIGEFKGDLTTHIVGLESRQLTTGSVTGSDTVVRTFCVPGDVKPGHVELTEQAGETIIRHIWDAGLILSALIANHSIPSFPALQDLTDSVFSSFAGKRDVKILEVGCGVGILGIITAICFPQCQVVMTDLMDAESFVNRNINQNLLEYKHLKDNASFRLLDWEERPFPSWTETEKFELVVMADVTYNTSTFSALTDTLEHLLQTGSKGAKVLCCGKRRHDEEEVFWTGIVQRGFVIEKRIVCAIDLEGNFRCIEIDSSKEAGEQLVDFVLFNLP